MSTGTGGSPTEIKGANEDKSLAVALVEVKPAATGNAMLVNDKRVVALLSRILERLDEIHETLLDS